MARRSTNRTKLFLLAALLCMGLVPSLAGAAGLPGERLVLASEYFQWREYLRDGTRLVEEKGTRVAFGMEASNHRRIYPGFLYRLGGRLYLGRLNYAGASRYPQDNLTPLNSHSDYLGLKLQAMGGQRYGFLFPGHMLDLKAGLAFEMWLRRVLDSRDASGQAASGFSTSYQVTTVRVAAGLFHRQGRRSSHLQIGLNYPLRIWQRGSNDTLDIQPGKDLGWFARFDLEGVLPFVNPRMGLSLYYENYRFKASETINGSYRPRTRMDSVGISVHF